jgi:acetyl esterase
MSAPKSTSPPLAAGVEQTTREFLLALAASGGPPMETLPPGEARQVLVGAQQSAGVSLPPADVTEKVIRVDSGSITLKIVKPQGAAGTLPAFMFFHGGGWVIGDFPTHERFIRDLVTNSGTAAVFVDYALSPESRFPTALNQAYAATKWVSEHGSEIGVDGARLAVAGNSAGGNLAAAVALMANQRGGPKLRCQVLFWPVTDANFMTASYGAFEHNYFLTRNMMKWFWDSYLPTVSERTNPLAAPLRATDGDLKGLPPTIVQTAEFDVLRDEGEAYANKLNAAGVEVVGLRVLGMIHDYGMLNALSNVPAVQAALHQAAGELRRRLG